MSNVIAPRPGDPIYLMCPKYLKRFTVKMKERGFFDVLLSKQKSKCPNCGNRNCIKDPAIQF